MDFYEFIRDFQSLLVGTVGFAGVAWTLRHNAKLTREQHELQVSWERESVRAVLLADLRQHLRVLESAVETLDTDDKDRGIMVPATSNTASYDKVLVEVGVLGVDVVEAVAEAYAFIRTLPEKASRTAAAFSNSPPETFEGLILVPPKGKTGIRIGVVATINHVRTAISTLERYAG